MKDIIERLRSTDTYGYQSQLACEASDIIESLRDSSDFDHSEYKRIREELRRQLAAMTAERKDIEISFRSVFKELAAMTAERDVLAKDKATFCMQYRMDCDVETKELEEELADTTLISRVAIADLQTKLAASQAYSQQLREALEPFANSYLATYSLPPNFAMLVLQARRILALPQDDTALRQAKAEVLRDAGKRVHGTDSFGYAEEVINRMADELEKS